MRHSSHPLRFLLHLEWILLSLVALSELLPRSLVEQLPRHPALNLIGLAVFTAMGWRLPPQPIAQGLYTALEFGLILLLSQAGGIRLFAVLYVVLVIRNCLILQGWVRSSVTGLAFLLAVWTQGQRLRSFATLPALLPVQERIGFLWFSFALLLGLVVLFLQFLVTAALSERQSREKLAIAHAQLRQYALRIEDQATLHERNRIAREIHDSLGHSLTAFNLHLEAALRLLPIDPEEAKTLLLEAKQIGSTALQEVRQSVATLRSDPLQGRSLAQAIAGLIEDFRRSTAVLPECEIHLTRPLSDDHKAAIYRIVQEALTNICKYAAASQVTIQIHSTDAELVVMIRDNGRGFAPQQTTTGFGLQGMQERTEALVGRFELVSAPDRGCQILARFPLVLPPDTP